MESKSIEFEALQEVCKYRSKCGRKCSEEDNFTGQCEDCECAIWQELGVGDLDEDEE